MKMTEPSRGTGTLNRLTAGIMLALGFMLSSIPVLAQDQDVTDQNDAEMVIEEVIVSGTRRALQNSIEIKRSATGIVDALSIGDIGRQDFRFPVFQRADTQKSSLSGNLRPKAPIAVNTIS